MKMSNKKARKIMGMFEVLNSILLSQAKEKHSGNEESFSTGYVQFECDIEKYTDWSCILLSEKMEISDGYIFGVSKQVSKLAWGGHEPSTVYLYDDPCRYKEFQSVIRFVRAAIKNNGLDGMKFGRIKVVSEMRDYLDFDVE
ncbi:hypothetical protein VPHK165_0057 [Vibrio phage K165]|nr:hypothetical protein MYOV022v2_p0044 [Vibrio phage 12E28.1]QZI90213.1 hypothetical protein MYOV021v2_p0044 [Vibrio phage 18E29.1]QZI90578.1 hypothetical protein MYOV023v1_p0031 [Vibrio phage 91E28.1a]QZI90672.1 hypothetical protein MYOV020v1_p0046 [Vibrio phage 98E28.6a]